MSHKKGEMKISAHHPFALLIGNNLIASVRRTFCFTEEDTENARRISAAWNACQNIETIDLENGLVDKVFQEFIKAKAENKRLKKALAEIKMIGEDAVRTYVERNDLTAILKICDEAGLETAKLFIGKPDGIEDIDEAPGEPDADDYTDHLLDQSYADQPTPYDP